MRYSIAAFENKLRNLQDITLGQVPLMLCKLSKGPTAYEWILNGENSSSKQSSLGEEYQFADEGRLA